MGYHAQVSAEAVGLTDYDVTQMVQDAPTWKIPPDTPVSGCVMRNGKSIPFTLETTHITPESYRVWPEQMIMAGLLLLSFAVPIYHLFG